MYMLIIPLFHLTSICHLVIDTSVTSQVGPFRVKDLDFNCLGKTRYAKNLPFNLYVTKINNKPHWKGIPSHNLK